MRGIPERYRPALRFAGVMAGGALVLFAALPPARRTPRPAAGPAGDEAALLHQRLTSGVAIAPGRWKTIIIHHSATTEGNAQRFDDYHRYTRGWEGGLGYHFVIGNGRGADDDTSADGEIEIGAHWFRQESGTHVRGYNADSIGVCLVGNFDEMDPDDPARPAEPTLRQMDALVRLVRELLTLCRLTPDDVLLHRDLVSTACPGRHFPAEAFRRRLTRPETLAAGPAP